MGCYGPIMKSGFGPLRTATEIHEILVEAEVADRLPSVIGYHRIDGPGSSLSLPLFQRAFYTLRQVPDNLSQDPSWSWSRGLPRTVGWTITTGTKVTARPFTMGKLAMESKDYEQLQHVEGEVREIPPIKRHWILKIMEALGLDGVMFSFENIDKRTRSGGLGGSATATTVAAILANHLAGNPMSDAQVVALASVCENDLGVSLTGTQEQWNVVAGGVTDYVWFPWGRPNEGTGYGDAMVRKLLPKETYSELLCRSALIHSGVERASTNVNRIWCARLKTVGGFKLHKAKLALAYDYAEALRGQDWELVARTIEFYRKIRTRLCPEYMAGAQWLEKTASDNDAVIFPLGAGGGGFILVWSPYPEAIAEIKRAVSESYGERVLEFGIRDTGHEFANPIPSNL